MYKHNLQYKSNAIIHKLLHLKDISATVQISNTLSFCMCWVPWPDNLILFLFSTKSGLSGFEVCFQEAGQRHTTNQNPGRSNNICRDPRKIDKHTSNQENRPTLKACPILNKQFWLDGRIELDRSCGQWESFQSHFTSRRSEKWKGLGYFATLHWREAIIKRWLTICDMKKGQMKTSCLWVALTYIVQFLSDQPAV